MKGKIHYSCQQAFHKLIIDDPNFYAVRIPTAFVVRVEDEVPDTATLNGSSGGSWHIKVVKGEDGISLVDGWETFCNDNNLAIRDVLLFRYSGNWCFNVQVFGPDGLEKMMKDFSETENGIQQTKKLGVAMNEKMFADSRKKKKVGPSALQRRKGKPRKEKFLSPKKQGTRANNLDRANWKDPKVSKLFIDLCLEELAAGHKDNGKMASISWEKIRLAFKEGNDIDFTIQQLRSHWFYLKRKYTTWSRMITATGNTNYDPVENKVNWSSEQWEQHLKINPEAKQFAEKSLEYPVEMMLLFDD